MRQEVINSTYTLQVVVKPEMSAILHNTLIHPVYSTFSLVYHVELAARRAIEPYFEQDDQAVGGGISVKHMAMAAIGETVEITVKIKEIQGSKIIADFIACIPSHSIIIAQGEQIQIMMKQSTVDQHILRAQQRLNNKS